MRNHLWSQILRCTTVALRELLVIQHLGQAVVNDFDVSCFIDHHIFEFQVSVRDAHFVEFANRGDDLGGIKLDYIFFEALFFLENLVELTTIDEGHDEVEANLRLEEIVHSTEERVISFEKDISLQQC